MIIAFDAIAYEALLLALVALAPIVGACVVAALIASAFQAMTQIRDPVLSFLPKLLAGGVALWVSGPWVVDRAARFLHAVLLAVPSVQ